MGIYWIFSIIVSQTPITCDTGISRSRNNIFLFNKPVDFLPIISLISFWTFNILEPTQPILRSPIFSPWLCKNTLLYICHRIISFQPSATCILKSRNQVFLSHSSLYSLIFQIHLVISFPSWTILHHKSLLIWNLYLITLLTLHTFC